MAVGPCHWLFFLDVTPCVTLLGMSSNTRWCSSSACVLEGVPPKAAATAVTPTKGLLDAVICWLGEGTEETAVVADWLRGWLIKDAVVACLVPAWEVVSNDLSAVGAVACPLSNWVTWLFRSIKVPYIFAALT